MKGMHLLKWFGYLWLAGSLLFVMAGMVDLGAKKGLSAVLDFLAPSRLFNWFVIAMTIAPGLLALLGAKQGRSGAQMVNPPESCLGN